MVDDAKNHMLLLYSRFAKCEELFYAVQNSAYYVECF